MCILFLKVYTEELSPAEFLFWSLLLAQHIFTDLTGSGTLCCMQQVQILISGRQSASAPLTAFPTASQYQQMHN